MGVVSRQEREKEVKSTSKEEEEESTVYPALPPPH